MTAFTASRDALAPALGRAAAVVPDRTPIPIMQCVLLETSDDGLFVTATDMDIVYREKIDETPRDPWRTCVDAERLHAFVAGAQPDSDIALRSDDEGRLAARAGRASCRLPTLPADDFPLFSRASEDAVELIFDAEAFAAGLRSVAPAMNTDPARYWLCGAFLDLGRLVASDGNQLALKTVATDMPPSPAVIIPGPTVLRLLPLLRTAEGPLPVTVSPTQIIINMSGWTLASKVIDGIYPDYRCVIPEHSPNPWLVRREALHSAAALVAKVGHDEKKVRALRLISGNGELLVENAGDDTLGACSVTVPLEGEPPADPQRVALNQRYLLSTLGALDAELVEIHINVPQFKIWICAAGEAHDGVLIMPMRL
jgi:DNA polymerase-3 subunit beta